MLFFEWIIVGLSLASLIDAGRLGKRAIEESNDISDLIATLSTNKHLFSAYFSERFEIKHLIGRGSNGAVFKAKDFQSARDVAVKFQYTNHKRCTQLSEVDIMLRIARQPEAIRTKINTVGYIGCGVERHGLAYIVYPFHPLPSNP
jgi:serine/threonine protein kinase